MAEVCQQVLSQSSEPPALVVHVAEVMGGRGMFILSRIDFLEPLETFPIIPQVHLV